MLRAIDVARKLAPKAHPAYLAALEAGDIQLKTAKITTPLRLAHFLAQVLHETGGLTVERESGSYSAARIVEIFGVGVHSAGITKAEAKKLANNGPLLFERAYGLGCPKMAAELGNTQPGDGWNLRGNGMNQGTGREYHERASKLTGVDFIGQPELATTADHALAFALCEWDATFIALSDKNDIRAVTKRLNGGYNGYAERVEWFNKIYAVLKKSDAPAWQVAKVSPDTRTLQKNLVALGYAIKIDGRYGPATTDAVVAFQKANGIRVDGVAGDVTLATMQARLGAFAADPAPATAQAVQVPSPVAGGASTAGVGAAAQAFIDKSQLLQPYTDVSEWVGYACAGLVGIGVCIALYGVVKTYVIPAIHKPSMPVAA
ncbi:peptidoglycan-binding protein [Xanthobacter sp. DSM 24535]|uniref:peptidoglycan-binding protein n=1 Tax=Roseixanthobacter psychrophilus TaxID=3119917 RepID=UPI0037291D87